MQSYDNLIEKWAPVLNEESAGTIKDSHRRAVTAAILENQEIALREQGLMEGPTTLPQLVLQHLAVQPITGIQF